MRIFENKENCTGCTACLHVCPQKCISMVQDEKGFLYPRIDEERCAECGLCRAICPNLNGQTVHQKHDCLATPIVYAAKHKELVVRMNSSSGGAFTAISDYFLQNGGLVYGAAFNENLKVCHIRTATITERDRLRGSKYVQSEMSDIYLKVEADLKTGNLVLFTGTPCQTAGLYAYLRVDYNNLCCCDLVCHGVPSSKIFDQYIKYYCAKNRAEIKTIKFRDKVSGWKRSSITIDSESRTDSHLLEDNPFTCLFFNDLIMRPSCYHCAYANLVRPSDITIADFWGIEKVKPEFDDDTGVSLILINSERGMKIFEKIQHRLYTEKSTIDDCMQWNLRNPTPQTDDVKIFWDDYGRKGFEYVINKYDRNSKLNRLKKMFYPLLHSVGLIRLINLTKSIINKYAGC